MRDLNANFSTVNVHNFLSNIKIFQGLQNKLAH